MVVHQRGVFTSLLGDVARRQLNNFYRTNRGSGRLNRCGYILRTKPSNQARCAWELMDAFLTREGRGYKGKTGKIVRNL